MPPESTLPYKPNVVYPPYVFAEDSFQGRDCKNNALVTDSYRLQKISSPLNPTHNFPSRLPIAPGAERTEEKIGKRVVPKARENGREPLRAIKSKLLGKVSTSASPSPLKASEKPEKYCGSDLIDMVDDSVGSNSTKFDISVPQASTSASADVTWCLKCLKAFRGKYAYRKSNLVRHEKSIHKRYIFQCPDCNKRYKRSDYLKRHFEAKHVKQSS